MKIQHSDFAVILLTDCACWDSACIDRAFRQVAKISNYKFAMLWENDFQWNFQSVIWGTSVEKKPKCAVIMGVVQAQKMVFLIRNSWNHFWLKFGLLNMFTWQDRPNKSRAHLSINQTFQAIWRIWIAKWPDILNPFHRHFSSLIECSNAFKPIVRTNFHWRFPH